MSMSQQTTETGAVLGKMASAPPVAASAASIAGISLPDPIQVLTGIWFAVLIAHKIWKWRKEAEQYRNGQEAKDDESEE